MGKWCREGILCICSMLCFWSLQVNNLSAATITVHGTDIYYSGNVEPEDVSKLESKINNYPNTNRVVITYSPGGSAVTGIKLGKLIRKYGLSTYIFNGCHSACNDIFAGGVFRDMDRSATIGIHSFGYDDDIEGYYTKEKFNEFTKHHFEVSVKTMHHYLKMGISIDVVLKMAEIPFNDMHFIRYHEAKQLNFVNK